jgi:hypothetical protein
MAPLSSGLPIRPTGMRRRMSWRVELHLGGYRTGRGRPASGINSLSPRKEHPVRIAERAAMLDHVDQVTKEHDPDRVHSTDRYRATAKPKYDKFTKPLPDIEWPPSCP